VAIGRGLMRLWPAAAEVLSGGRLRRPAGAPIAGLQLSSA